MIKKITSLFRRKKNRNPIIIVSGLPRSGTSMMMAFLQAGGIQLMLDGIRVADEDNPRGYYELEPVKDLDKTEDKSWLDEARGKAVKIISYLLKDLPKSHDYRVIFMHRDLDEIEASQKKMLRRRGEPTDTTRSEDMRQIYEDHLRKVKYMLEHEPNFQHIDVEYKEAVRDPQKQVRRVNEFLGGGLDVQAMVAVVDESLYRNRK